jgi:aspartate/methionine/tyrosine aminotransferase
MDIKEFKLERYYAIYEFTARYMFSSSDCESLRLNELLEIADQESLDYWQNLSLGYTESQGWPRLREQIAASYDQVDASRVMVSAPEEAIFVAMNSLLKNRDEVIVVTPAYQSLYEIARWIGCRVKFWRLNLGEHGWVLDLEQLRQMINPKTKLIVINFPHNPTGHQISLVELEEIISIARSHKLTLFSDEMYRLLEPDDSLRLPAVCDLYEMGISLSGLSKAFALPGLRMGWLATQQASFVQRFLVMKDYTTICNSASSEVLAFMALKNRDIILQRNRTIIRKNCQLAEKFFQKHNHLLRWIPPVAGSVAFPLWMGERSVDQFCREAVESEGVMIVPGSQFEDKGNHFRLGFGRKNFGEALEHLDAFLQKKIYH